ncbi:hypothetical protein BDC45DRAFT_533899 [Circinella umbellata]|nr:hypothetical protein BDC45DRAFT_533899 [Circinella umbellata]
MIPLRLLFTILVMNWFKTLVLLGDIAPSGHTGDNDDESSDLFSDTGTCNIDKKWMCSLDSQHFPFLSAGMLDKRAAKLLLTDLSKLDNMLSSNGLFNLYIAFLKDDKDDTGLLTREKLDIDCGTKSMCL